MALSLSVLGPLHIALNDRPITTFESDKARALLIYLAVEADRPQRRATLAALLWPDQSERGARHNLSQALFNLRHAINDHAAQPSFLLISRDTVQFNTASDHKLDAATFRALIAACGAHQHRRVQSCAPCADRLMAASELYRGDFLAQFSLAGSAAFEEWSLIQRERLRQAALEALTTLGTYYELRGEYEGAREYALKQLALDPWRESAYRQLMRVLALHGQRTAALATYDRCYAVLAEQLGVEPEAETTALAEQIRAAEDDLPLQTTVRARPAPRPNNLPAQLTPFVGREAELTQLGDMLANPHCRLITIVGPGGIGKTRLALQAALEQLDTFADGVLWVSLAHLHESALVPQTIAQALELPLHGADELSAQLLAYLRPKELLLVLDNFEQLLDAAPWLTDLLRGAGGVTLLVTSRERLELHAEWLVDVGGLTLPDERGVAIEQSSASQLWLQTAQRVRAGYSLTGTDRACVAQICRLVEGMPLAIELAAAWVRMLACSEIAENIGKGLALLSTSARDVPDRHRSVRAVLDHSWNLLPPEEQRVLRQLAVFRGGFGSVAAAHIANADGEHLTALVDKSLLRVSPHAALQRRYDLHEIVRHYAFDHLEAAGDKEQVCNRHLAYYLDLAEQAALHFSKAEEAQWMERLEADHGNLRSALQWAMQPGAADLAARICGALWRFWQMRGYFTEGRDWIARVLTLVTGSPADKDKANNPAIHTDCVQREVDKNVQAHVLKGAGVLAWAQSDYAEARAAFETSLAIYRTLSDTDGIAAVSSNLGVLALYQGQYEQATELLQTSLKLRRELNDASGIAICLNNLGAMAGKRGDLPLAQAYYEEGLALYREMGYERGIATLLGNLGDVAEDRGDLVSARRFATESLQMHHKLGNTAGSVAALTRLASLALRRNDLKEARSRYAESLELLEALGDKEYIAICLEGFAAIAALQQRWRHAVQLWGAADALRVAIDVPLSPDLRPAYAHKLAVAHTQLDAQAFASAWAEGRGMSVEQARVYALEMQISASR